MNTIKWLDNYSNERQDSVWYGGDVVSIENERYIFTIEAIGDIGIELDGDYYKDKNNTGYIGEILKEHGITTDKELRKAEDEGRIKWLDNNWFEYRVWDKELKDWVDNGIDNVLDDSFDENDDFNWVDDIEYQLYVGQWEDEHDEGEPACFKEWLACGRG